MGWWRCLASCKGENCKTSHLTTSLLLLSVQVIANTQYVLNMGGTPHEVVLRSGAHMVNEHMQEFKGPKTPTASWDKVRTRGDGGETGLLGMVFKLGLELRCAAGF